MDLQIAPTGLPRHQRLKTRRGRAGGSFPDKLTVPAAARGQGKPPTAVQAEQRMAYWLPPFALHWSEPTAERSIVIRAANSSQRSAGPAGIGPAWCRGHNAKNPPLRAADWPLNAQTPLCTAQCRVHRFGDSRLCAGGWVSAAPVANGQTRPTFRATCAMRQRGPASERA